MWLLLILDGDNVILQLFLFFTSVSGHTQQKSAATMTFSPGASKELMLGYCLLWLWLIMKEDKFNVFLVLPLAHVGYSNYQSGYRQIHIMSQNLLKQFYWSLVAIVNDC